MAGKYDPLNQFLAEQTEDEITLSFDRLERLLGFPLPDSARHHPAWWANQNPPSVQSRAWTSAGWRASASLSSQHVTFRRENRFPQRPRPRATTETTKTALADQLLED